MTNYERLMSMTDGELGEFLGEMATYTLADGCEYCPARADICDPDDHITDTCPKVLKRWAESPYLGNEKYSNGAYLRTLKPFFLAMWLAGHIMIYLHKADSCTICPAISQCKTRCGKFCDGAVLKWLISPVESEPVDAEEAADSGEPVIISLPPISERFKHPRDLENHLLELIEDYEAGTLMESNNELDHVIKCYLGGCGCLYCGKSAIPERSPEKDICTPADCARGLAEYLRRMED